MKKLVSEILKRVMWSLFLILLGCNFNREGEKLCANVHLKLELLFVGKIIVDGPRIGKNTPSK
jgi:hypothetical protein